MRTMTKAAPALALALTLTLPPSAAADQVGLRADGATHTRATPEAWNPQDPADSLFRAARDAMNRADYARAADLFRQVWESHPRSSYAPDAPYWEAFNRYRLGETRDLERALAALKLQEERYAGAATRESGDAAGLAARINGMLARRGDAAAAETVFDISRIAAEVGREMAAVGRDAAEAGRLAAALAREATSFGPGRRADDVPAHCREEVEVQLAALNALLQMRAETAMPVLARVMARRDECSPPIRRRATFMVSNRGGDQAVDLLLDAARNDPDLDVRRQAVFWLSQVRDPRAVGVLAEFATTGDDERLREHAVFALSQNRDPRARDVLRRVAQDEAAPAKLRSNAVFWLGQSASAEDVAFLRGLFGRTGNPDLDDRVLFAVSQAGGRDNARWLVSVAGDGRVPVDLRKKAVFWAGQAGAPAGELGALYEATADREMKDRILFALSQSRQPEAIDRLIRIARTETDPRLRQRAIFWLGNSNDPRAAQLLMEILAPRDG